MLFSASYINRLSNSTIAKNTLEIIPELITEMYYQRLNSNPQSKEFGHDIIFDSLS